ncbi:MAG: zf-HC2 domain-containing protein [Lachnospiraceae bacterium]|nr:zf-HC2 domain-containing protein [Lachnospiraceae bacterium]
MKTNNCAVVKDLLPLYVDGVLSAESCEFVEGHLNSCTECTAYCEQLKGADVTVVKKEAADDKKVIQNIRKGINKKRKRVALITVLSVVAALALIGILGFRLVILYFSKQVTTDFNPSVEYFTEYDRTMADTEAVQEIKLNGIAVNLPAEYAEMDPVAESFRYGTADEEGNPVNQVLIMPPSDVSELNLFGEENMESLPDFPLGQFVVNQLRKGYEDLGHGMPDDFYHMTKANFLLTKEDYSFWNWQKGLAYTISSYIKNQTPVIADYVLIYEEDDICGFIYVTDKSAKEGSNSAAYDYYVIADLFGTSDLSTGYGMIITGDSLEEIYAIINSVVIE